jgi:hypothetical protein
LKKLAFLASAAVALVCAASLVATPAEAKKHYYKRPAAAAAAVAYGYGPGPGYGYGYGWHNLGGPARSGAMCWKDAEGFGTHTQGQFGWYEACK